MELRMRRWPSTTPRSYTVLVLCSLYLPVLVPLPLQLVLVQLVFEPVCLYFCLYFFSCGLPCTVLPPGLVQVCTLCIWPGAKSSCSLDSIPLFALILTHSTLTSPSSLSFGLLLVGAANAFEGKD